MATSASSFEIAKAGWLHRQTSFLRRWRRSWFVLYQDGTLRYFETPENHTSEEAVRVPTDCLRIDIGKQVQDVTPPEGVAVGCLLKVVFRDKTWLLCAESPDDVSAWQFSLEQARVISHRPAPHGRPNSAPPPYAAQAVTSGQTQVVYPAQGGAVYPQQQQAYAYPGQNYYGSNPPQYVVQAPPGQTTTTVVYTDRPGYRYYRRGYRHGYDGTDMAMGVVAGAAIGSMMWGPVFWC